MGIDSVAKNYSGYKTDMGYCFQGNSEELLQGDLGKELEGKVQLIITSPPYPLTKQKKYGNLQGEEYLKWFASFAPIFSKLLTPDGSIVIEIGNAWEPGRPVQSLLPLRTLMEFVSNEEAGLRLCQQFICHNPARLPSPAEWVTIERSRVTDSFTHVWWMSATDYPKADNRRVLRPYSKSQLRLMKNKKYNDGERPSGHKVSEDSFFKDNGGSITPNVIELEPIDDTKELRLPYAAFSFANTQSKDFFLTQCRERGIKGHPARMPLPLASFFINFLTDPGDIVLDPFSGSNTTGFCAERLERKWVGVELDSAYIDQSKIRFEELETTIQTLNS